MKAMQSEVHRSGEVDAVKSGTEEQLADLKIQDETG